MQKFHYISLNFKSGILLLAIPNQYIQIDISFYLLNINDWLINFHTLIAA